MLQRLVCHNSSLTEPLGAALRGRPYGQLGYATRGMNAAELDPARTWVFAVSVTEYRDPTYTSLPTHADTDLIRQFRRRGVPEDRIVFLRDHKATLLGIRTALNAMLPRASKGDLLFLYFGGHGGQGYFCPYDAGSDPAASHWGIPEILTRIDSFFGGDRVLLIADTCYSGSLATALRARTVRKKSYSVLTSTTGTAVSRGETLTRCLIDALRGDSKVDIDSDGRVTVRELGAYATAQVKSAFQQKAMYLTFGRSDEELVLASNKPQPAQVDPATQAGVEVEWQGTWFPANILDSDGDRYRTRYVGWGPEWDEWVGRDRIRKRGPAHDAHALARLQAGASGGTLIGQVAAVLLPADSATAASSFVDTQQVITRTTSTVSDSIPAASAHHGSTAKATTCPCCR